uniref:Protein krueppel n=1 Tax=Anopheles minimus TaxID=112268 RepID=A0A1Y9IVJ5_9DIPT
MDGVLASHSEGKLASDVCRGCGGKNAIKPLSVYGNIFKWCTSIDVSCSDGLPSNICNRCLQMLSISYEFKMICTRTDRNLRAKTSDIAQVESVTSIENSSSDDYEQSELVYEVQTEEIVEEMVITDKESVDYLYKTIPELKQCITKGPEDTKQNAISELEHLSDECYLLQVAEKSDEIPSFNAQELHEVQDTDDREKSEELAFGDAVEYLTDTCKEISPVHEHSQTFSKSVSIVDVKHVPKSSQRHSVGHSCPDCGKEFASRTNMYRHQHAHRGTKPYKCDICKKSFTQSGTLKTHKYMHLNIKPYECNVCGQRFTQSKSVKLHLRRHTGEKPFVCDICNAAFRQKNGLQRHMKVHGEKG